MTIGLLATGDEIVIGDTLNTNGYHIAHALHAEGLILGLHLTCDDDENTIHNCLQFLAAQHDVIIITGGLGPTSDDKTRFALAAMMQESLVEFPKALEHIQNRIKNNQLALTPGNRQQALFPPSAILLPNPFGTTMGCYCYWQNKLLVLLPGPPRECLPMFNQHVLAVLQNQLHSDKQLLKWRVFAVAESQIAQQMDEALVGIDCQTGYRLETPYIECKVRCRPELVDQIKAIVDPLLQPHIIATPEKKASELLIELISQQQIKLSIQDNITGGHLQSLLETPATHQLLNFNGQVRYPFHFELQGLKEYWQQQNANQTTVKIKYICNSQSGIDEQQFAYRSPLIINIAAEWICFKLLELIIRK